MGIERTLRDELARNHGILRFAPCWVARRHMEPGRRLKLHPGDVYAYGVQYGGINERWFASTTRATKNGEGVPDEGLSRIVLSGAAGPGEVLFRDAVDGAGDELLGADVMSAYGGWTVYSKFFDNRGPISFHLHMMEKHARAFGERGKPEAYYFPPQLNAIEHDFPHSYFGIEPGTRPEDLLDCVRDWGGAPSEILKFSRAYRLKVGTGWDVPAGVIHSPGSLVTYEPQSASDVNVFYQNLVNGRFNPRDPGQYVSNGNAEYLVELIDWETNTDPAFKEKRFRLPMPVDPGNIPRESGQDEQWICYGREDFCAKELTVLPGRTATVKDAAAYGFIVVQGHGSANGVCVESPSMIRFGDLTSDEFFVTQSAAREGVTIVNTSPTENLVMLKHFGPGNPDAAHLVVHDGV